MNISEALRGQLEALGLATQRDPAALTHEAIQRYVESETRIIESIKRAQRQLGDGLGISHAEIIRQTDMLIKNAFARAGS